MRGGTQTSPSNLSNLHTQFKNFRRGREHGKSKAEELARRQRIRDEGRWAQKVDVSGEEERR